MLEKLTGNGHVVLPLGGCRFGFPLTLAHAIRSVFARYRSFSVCLTFRELPIAQSIQRGSLRTRAPRYKYKPLGGDANTMVGINIHAGIIDESHIHKTPDVWNVLKTSTAARRGNGATRYLIPARRGGSDWARVRVRVIRWLAPRGSDCPLPHPPAEDGFGRSSSSSESGSSSCGLYSAISLRIRGWSGLSSSERCQCSRARSRYSVWVLSSK